MIKKKFKNYAHIEQALTMFKIWFTFISESLKGLFEEQIVSGNPVLGTYYWWGFWFIFLQRHLQILSLQT
jgi:hypothetical protein